MHVPCHAHNTPCRERIDDANADGQTAKILVKEHKRASLHLEPLLRDRDMGSLQGGPWADFPEQVGAGVESDAE
jgi:broad specificity phosphatase PhoE